jgi:DNA-binding response OmpR family regulator
VVVAHDGVGALDYLFDTGVHADGNIPPLPEIVMLDLHLPKVSGLEVLKRLRAHNRTAPLPVIIFTSSEQEKDMLTGYRLVANSYVAKPVDFNQFAKEVQELGFTGWS